MSAPLRLCDCGHQAKLHQSPGRRFGFMVACTGCGRTTQWCRDPGAAAGWWNKIAGHRKRR